MTTKEMFPPSQQELEEMIYTVTKKLEDERYRDEWPELSEQLKELEQQLEENKNQN